MHVCVCTCEQVCVSMSARMQRYVHSSCKQQRSRSRAEQEGGLGPGPQGRWRHQQPRDRLLPFSLCSPEPRLSGFHGRTGRLGQVGGHQGSQWRLAREPRPGRLTLFPGAVSVEFTSPLHSFQLPLALSLPLRAATEKSENDQARCHWGSRCGGCRGGRHGAKPGSLLPPPPCSGLLEPGILALHILQASECCGQQGRATALEGRGQRGDSPAPPPRVRKWPVSWKSCHRQCPVRWEGSPSLLS